VIRAFAPYMGFHNAGTVQTGGHLPQRKFMGESREMNEKAMKTIDKFMNRIGRR
jgi:phage gpG-like protein